jgi:hypothetical protein
MVLMVCFFHDFGLASPLPWLDISITSIMFFIFCQFFNFRARGMGNVLKFFPIPFRLSKKTKVRAMEEGIFHGLI